MGSLDRWVVYKYPVHFGANFVTAPASLQVTHFGVQDGQMMFWAVIDNEYPVMEHEFRVVGTGYDVERPWKSVHSMQNGDFVWHIFHLHPQPKD